VKRLLTLIVAAALCWTAPSQAARYGVARSATPVLNSPAFNTVFGGSDGKTLKADRCGQVRELEFIALPGTPFKLLGETHGKTATIYRVETDDYPAPDGRKLYVDSRFIEKRSEKPPPRARSLPARQEIITSLKAAIGSPYVWGGNMSEGVGELTGLFYHGLMPGKNHGNLILSGVDCSGLLYQATGGWTPRNTSQLLSFGTGIPVGGKSVAELVKILEPLDLIVWDGHVIIVLDRETAIESRLKCESPGRGGVVATPLTKRLEEILRTRRAVDVWPKAGNLREVFVVRRWFNL
jgi:cell wall-associated NlpC family hydrolase